MPKLPRPELDLRLVWYFTVVAEHRHFGRAAAELRVAQPSLSRQIRRLEDQVGVQLLDRVPNGAQLTKAGQAFLPQAEALLRGAVEAAEVAVTAAASNQVTIGYTADIVITAAVAELRRRHPEATVRALHLSWDEPISALITHRVDAAVTRLPLPATDAVALTPLFEEPRVVMLAVTHRLAQHASLTLDDLADEPLPRVSDDHFDAFWRIDPRPNGRPAPDGPVVHSLEDKLELVASGQAVAIVPGAVGANHFLRRDLTTIPLEQVAPARVVLATRADDRNPLVATFHDVAHTYITAPGGPDTNSRSGA